jgi:flagellar hook assembly protein FlgD
LGSAASELILEIYDSSGDLVFIRSLDAAYLTPQAHEFAWDGRSSWGKALNNGVYFARLTGGITTEFLKIAIADR